MKVNYLYLLGLMVPFSCVSAELGLDEFLDEVTKRNGAVRGTQISFQAKSQRQDEGSLFFKPSFFLTGEYMDDQRPTNSPMFMGNQTLRHTVKTGVTQNLRYGTKLSLGYNMSRTQVNGTSGGILPMPKFYDSSPVVEISQSLWRNFLGSETEANEKLQNSQNEAQMYNAQFSYKQLLMDAKNAYWRFYYAQRSLVVQEESLERAKKLRDWNSGSFSS